MIFKPYDYQKYATCHVLDHKYCGLFLDMGLGKTVITLTALQELMLDRFEISKVLVIAPLKVAENVWESEIRKWNHLKGLKLSKVLGTEKQRIEALRTNADIYVINRENTEWLVKHYGVNKWPFDMVVVDELSSFKSSKAKRFRALRKIRPKLKRFVGLTGTPSPNGYLDLWPQMYLIDRGERLGSTLTRYRDLYFEPGKRNRHIIYEWNLKDNADKTISGKIKDICISMKSEDYINLPERIPVNVELNMPDTLKKQYKQFEKDQIMQVVDGVVTAGSAASLYNKLLQFANGAVYDEDHKVQHIHDIKLDALSEIVSVSTSPVLIFYNFIHDKNRILKQFKNARVLETPKDESDWNAGLIDVLVAHPASCGHGLNLQSGGSVIVWFGVTWNLELYLQANKRLHRQGQTKPVIIHHLLVKNSVDGLVLKALNNKDESQKELIRAVKARISKVLEG